MEMNDVTERGLREGDLELILTHKLVKEASIEPNMGFGTGVLKDGRIFEFGRANEELEIAIFNKIEDMENGLEADEYIILNDTSFMR